jgi:hypothetical protein
MTMRTAQRTVTFTRPFRLGESCEQYPAGADSDEAAQAFRFDDALCSGMMAPRALSLAG